MGALAPRKNFKARARQARQLLLWATKRYWRPRSIGDGSGAGAVWHHRAPSSTMAACSSNAPIDRTAPKPYTQMRYSFRCKALETEVLPSYCGPIGGTRHQASPAERADILLPPGTHTQGGTDGSFHPSWSRHKDIHQR